MGTELWATKAVTISTVSSLELKASASNVDTASPQMSARLAIRWHGSFVDSRAFLAAPPVPLSPRTRFDSGRNRSGCQVWGGTRRCTCCARLCFDLSRAPDLKMDDAVWKQLHASLMSDRSTDKGPVAAYANGADEVRLANVSVGMPCYWQERARGLHVSLPARRRMIDIGASGKLVLNFSRRPRP